jgi:acyl-[acyl carrier protein]--UDP-N-acetylglucosamine O-acyltransferase
VGAGAIIGAGSVITKNVPPYSIIVGNPGRVVGTRFTDTVISELLELKWWDLDLEVISNLPFDNIFKVISILKEIRSQKE